jgi:hypothetical protein
MITA